METHIRYLACGSGDILAFRSIYELPLELYAQIAELATYFAAEDNLSGRGTDFPMADWEDIVQWLDDGDLAYRLKEHDIEYLGHPSPQDMVFAVIANEREIFYTDWDVSLAEKHLADIEENFS